MTKQHVRQVFEAQQAMNRMGGKDILEKMGRYFVSYVPSLVEAMEDAFEVGEWDRLKQANHKLLGSVGNFGENKAYYAALQLQKTLEHHNIEQTTQQFAQVLKEVNALKSALQHFVGDSHHSSSQLL